MSRIKIKRIDDSDITQIRDVWERLSETYSDSIFQSFDWIHSWLKRHEAYIKPLILLATENGNPIAVAPLAITREKFNRVPTRKLRLIKNTDFIIPSRREEVVREIFNYLKDIRKSWDLIDFSEFNYDTEIADLFKKEAEKSNLDFLLKEAQPFPYIDVDTTWEDYFSHRKNRYKRKFRNLSKRIDKLGNVSLSINIYDTSQKKEIEEGFKKLYTLNKKSWKGNSPLSIFYSEVNRHFYVLLMDTFSKKGKIEVSFLEHKGVPIAGSFGIVYKNIYYWLHICYDKEYSKLSPGNVLMHALLKKVFSNNGDISRVELLKGLYPQKSMWLTGMHKKLHIMVFKKSLRGGILKFSETHVREWMGFNDKT